MSKGLIPGKHAIMSGLIVFAIGILIYNKVPKVRALLGAAG